ncbi:MAG: hypothetical protein ACRDT0_15550 [Pseudonocardiaceae bacterium]
MLQDEHSSLLQAMIDAANRADQLAAQPAADPAVAAVDVYCPEHHDAPAVPGLDGIEPNPPK